MKFCGPPASPWWGCSAPPGGSQRAEPCLLNALGWVSPPYPELRLGVVPLPGKRQTPGNSVRYFPAGKLRSGDTPRLQQSGGSEGPQEGQCHLPAPRPPLTKSISHPCLRVELRSQRESASWLGNFSASLGSSLLICKMGRTLSLIHRCDVRIQWVNMEKVHKK